MNRKPEPSKEEILENITNILQQGEPPNKKPDEEMENIIAGLAKILSEPPPPLPPEPKPDWIAKTFVFLANLLPALVLMAATVALIVGTAVVIHRLGGDSMTVAVYSVTAFLMVPVAVFLPFGDPQKGLRRREGRKASRYVWWTLVWGGLLLVITREWMVVVACVAFVLMTQVCVAWLVEMIFVPLRRLADVLEAGFRRRVGVPAPPLELINEVDPVSE